jgi:hypothetical protein
LLLVIIRQLYVMLSPSVSQMLVALIAISGGSVCLNFLAALERGMPQLLALAPPGVIAGGVAGCGGSPLALLTAYVACVGVLPQKLQNPGWEAYESFPDLDPDPELAQAEALNASNVFIVNVSNSASNLWGYLPDVAYRDVRFTVYRDQPILGIGFALGIAVCWTPTGVDWVFVGISILVQRIRRTIKRWCACCRRGSSETSRYDLSPVRL